jgi:hypothetical protein
MCQDLGVTLPTLQRAKKTLTGLDLIEVRVRHKSNSSGQTSNYYFIKTPLVSNYTPAKEVDRGGINKVGAGGVKEIGTTLSNISSMPPAKELGNKVLTTEKLTSKELSIEELEREKEKALSLNRLYVTAEIFSDLIRTFWKDHEDYKSYYLHYKKENIDSTYKDIDATTERFLKKICVAAEQIYESFKTLKESGRREKLRAGDGQITREGAISIFSEANLQVNAYFDFCRLSGTHMTTDPEKIPGKLIQGDWCTRLFDFIRPKIEKEEYDPAVDAELLLSEWLINMYYWQPIVYECRRYGNRIVYDGQEYLYHKRA